MDDELPGHRSGACLYYISYDDQGHAYNMYPDRLAQLAELSRSEFDPELFSHCAYVEFFVTFATKMAYLIFCVKMRQLFIYERVKEGGNNEKMRKCRE